MLVGYARVSTREQNHALQLDALRAAGCERVYTEKASGAQRDRPELEAALDFAREGDTLVVWKLDRLARSIRQLIETVEDLERRKIGLRSLTEAIDTTTAGGRLVFHVFAALAEFERSVIRERTAAGLEAAQGRAPASAIPGRPNRGQGAAARPGDHGRGGGAAAAGGRGDALPLPPWRAQRAGRGGRRPLTPGRRGAALIPP